MKNILKGKKSLKELKMNSKTLIAIIFVTSVIGIIILDNNRTQLKIREMELKYYDRDDAKSNFVITFDEGFIDA